MDAIIIIRKIQVEAANAIAGFTWGFPAITNFLGYVHALQRRLPTKYKLTLDGCGVICHQHHVHSYQASEYADHVFALTRNPLDKTGKTASFNEEGRMDMEISLVIAINDGSADGIDDEEIHDLRLVLFELVQTQHLAGGVVVNTPHIDFIRSDKFIKKHKAYMRSLLPGFCLVSRHDLLLEQQQLYREQCIKNAELRAWLDFSAITYQAAEQDKEHPEKSKWELQAKPYKGWIKPIGIGYRSISPLYPPGEVAKTRDPYTPARFVENLYSIGQWISPHRINDVADICWRYETTHNGDYLCRNHYPS